jgi:hypothetical protein
LDLLQALIRGPVQGAAEPLTLSSAALAAVLLYFWRDWLTIWCAGFYALRTRFTQDPEVRLLRRLMEGTIATAGFLLETPRIFSDRSVFAAVRRVLGMWWASPLAADRTSSNLNVGHTVLVSLAQAGAIRPSRWHVPAGTGRRMRGPAAGVDRRLVMPGDKAFLRCLFWETASVQGMFVPLGQGCGFAGWFGALSLLVALLL